MFCINSIVKCFVVLCNEDTCQLIQTHTLTVIPHNFPILKMTNCLYSSSSLLWCNSCMCCLSQLSNRYSSVLLMALSNYRGHIVIKKHLHNMVQIIKINKCRMWDVRIYQLKVIRVLPLYQIGNSCFIAWIQWQPPLVMIGSMLKQIYSTLTSIECMESIAKHKTRAMHKHWTAISFE